MSGILGVFSFNGIEAFPHLYYGLYALQHRGQAAVGMGTIARDGALTLIREKGLISEHFGDGLIEHMPGNKGIGFVQYPFENRESEPMPFSHEGALMAIDGEVENADFSYQACIDVLGKDFEEIKSYFEGLVGKFTLIYMNKDRFIAYKHTDGIKPLAIGKLGDTIIASSETAAIDSIAGQVIREIQPGELFIQTKKQSISYYLSANMAATENLDAFEFIYTARPDSILDGISVYDARYRLGETLWQEDQLHKGIVIGAPDSGTISSLGYAKASGLPYQQGFVRNRYIGRTFIQSSQTIRERNIEIKLTPIRSIVANREIILIDDSIVRGSTIRRTVNSLREAGASKIHVRIAAPPVVKDESITVDIPNKQQLVAYNRSVDEVRDLIGCDSLKYISLEGFHRAIGRNKLYEPYFTEE
ncbi:amidophosphoribosyltransferase [Aerococcaceae bacterium 50-4]